jgi:hypothetical protein
MAFAWSNYDITFKWGLEKHRILLGFESFAVELEHVLAEGVVFRRHDLQTLAAAGPLLRVVIVEVNGQVFLLHRVLKARFS